MKDFNYKGFIGSQEFDTESNTLWGKVKYIKGLITYESPDGSMPGLINAFHEAVDEYLEDCNELGLTPYASATGIFQVRLGPELHHKANAKANEEDITLNELVKKAIDAYIDENGIHYHHHQQEHNHTHIHTASPFADNYGQEKRVSSNANRHKETQEPSKAMVWN